MHLIFFDEAKNDDDYAYYHLGAVAIDETHLSMVEAAINALSVESFGTAVLESGTEFHAAEIYHRKKHFKDWKDVGKRMDLLGRFIDILNMPEVLLIDIKINCELYKGPPDDIGFMYLVERAQGLMRSKKQLGLLIGDRDTDQSAARSARSLSNWREHGTDFAYGIKIENLVDSVHFTPSHLSRFLQLADVYTWLKQFRHRNAKSTEARHKTLLDLASRDYVDLWPNTYKTWPKK